MRRLYCRVVFCVLKMKREHGKRRLVNLSRLTCNLDAIKESLKNHHESQQRAK